MNRHFVFIVGTRAQLIKVAPVIATCEQRKATCTLLMTGQHVETMQDLLDEFKIRAPQQTAVSAQERATVGSLFRWLPRAYFGTLKQLRKLNTPAQNIDVLVHGDTLSTVIGAVAGRQFGARVVHLESGLTSGAILDPFPEELSRRIVFRLTHIAMCPNAQTTEHMRKHYPRCQAVNTQGNTILDAVALAGTMRTNVKHEPPYLVVSLHRFQNIYDNDRLRSLVDLLETLSSNYPIHFVLHPATRKRLQKLALIDRLGSMQGITLSPRLGYSDFLHLAAGAACVLTDGGSNQEELAAIGTPTIVMRKTTERQDGLGANAVMEDQVPEGVANFLLSGSYMKLETPKATMTTSPSATILDALQRA